MTDQKVYLLEHLHTMPGGEDDVKTIGIYSSKAKAEEAVERLKSASGFREWPNIIDPLTDDETNGFYIDEYALDRDHWEEGFVTQ